MINKISNLLLVAWFIVKWLETWGRPYFERPLSRVKRLLRKAFRS
jgi:hypothetical protein